MNPGSSAWLHPHVVRMGVGTQGAPAWHPSCGQGGRGGSLGGNGESPSSEAQGWLQGPVSSGLQGWVKHPAGICLALCRASHLCKPSFSDEVSILGQWQGDIFTVPQEKCHF